VTKGLETESRPIMITAFYPGSFDPMTNGHLDILVQALALTPRVIVAIGVHPGKTPLFSFEERADLIRRSIADVLPEKADGVSVVLLCPSVRAARSGAAASWLLRGSRGGAGPDSEMRRGGMTRSMAPDFPPVSVPAGPAWRPMSATLVRQIAAMGGDVSGFVPATVFRALKARFVS